MEAGKGPGSRALRTAWWSPVDQCLRDECPSKGFSKVMVFQGRDDPQEPEGAGWGGGVGSESPPICMQFREVRCLKVKILAAQEALAFSVKRPRRLPVKTEVSC